jgi:hypothetical protein
MSVSITCPSPVGTCGGAINSPNACAGGDASSCGSDMFCAWSPAQSYCSGSVNLYCYNYDVNTCPGVLGCTFNVDNNACEIDPAFGSCSGLGQSNCAQIPGCYYNEGQGGTCSRNSVGCANFAGNNCPTNLGCELNWQ